MLLLSKLLVLTIVRLVQTHEIAGSYEAEIRRQTHVRQNSAWTHEVEIGTWTCTRQNLACTHEVEIGTRTLFIGLSKSPIQDPSG